MKTIQALALLGAVLIAACSERNFATAPAADAAMGASAASIGDRPYTWTFTCKGDAYITASWYWTANGIPITETSYARNCNSTVLSGTGVRPGSANGFSACVEGNPVTCEGWSFDPALAFSVVLNGSATYVECKFRDWKLHCHPVSKATGTLTVDS